MGQVLLRNYKMTIKLNKQENLKYPLGSIQNCFELV